MTIFRSRQLTSSHYGAYEVVGASDGRPALRALREDPDPSPIGLRMVEAYDSPLRVKRPAVRASWLRDGPGSAPHLRGREPFVEVPWDQALDLVAAEIERVRKDHGNAAIFGGSYGWSSAGRFHHAQSQVHRFLNAAGGYVRHTDSYSLGAARVLLPHVLVTMEQFSPGHHSWDVLAANTRLMVCFGGLPLKNAQIAPGGNSLHSARGGIEAMAKNGCRFINFGPSQTDLTGSPAVRDAIEWLPIRPGSDTAVMLALIHAIASKGRHDTTFLQRYTVGFERVLAYVMGERDGIVKDCEWAAALSGVPAARLARLADELLAQRSFINVAWSLQRSDHGEQPFWSAITLASALGQIGLPGGGIGAYGPTGTMGSPHVQLAGPVLSQGRNPVAEFIPVARIADMLLHPGESFDYNGQRRVYPDIKLVYWAGGNPFHHHQDLSRLTKAWQHPETIVVNEHVWTYAARMADVVLPATTTLERDDIGYATRDACLIAMRKVTQPHGEARDDYDIFAALARRLGCEDVFTEGLDSGQWLRRLYEECRPRILAAGVTLPGFDEFREQGMVPLPEQSRPLVMFEAFRSDPQAHRLNTPSGLIELFSERIDSFGYADCPGHATWFAPAEWLGAPLAARFPLHMLSNQPARRLHSQLDFGPYSLEHKVQGREPISMNTADAAARGIAHGDIVRVFNDRGACLAGAVVTETIMPGVVNLPTGAWFDPVEPGVPGSLDKHGNPNVLTRDAPASSLSQGCAAQTCLVQVERFEGTPPAITAFEPPTLLQALPGTG